MNATEIKKTTSLRLNGNLYRYIQKLAKRENRSVNNFIETVLADATHFYEPNEETKQSIEEARAERLDLKQYESADDLLSDLMRD